MVGYLHNAVVSVDIISTKKIKNAFVGKDRRRLGIVLEPTQITIVVHRPRKETGPVVIRAEGHGIDESGARRVRQCCVVPEIVGMETIGRVRDRNLLIEHCPAGMQC